jgi:hypothetical protein
MFEEKGLIGVGRSIKIDAKCSSKKQLAMLCYHWGVSISHLVTVCCLLMPEQEHD